MGRETNNVVQYNFYDVTQARFPGEVAFFMSNIKYQISKILILAIALLIDIHLFTLIEGLVQSPTIGC